PPGSSAASGSVTSSPRRLIDVSHTIEHGMVTYPGLPVPVVSDWLPRDASQARYAPGTTFQIGKIDLLANTGTYIDAPFHRYDGGKDVADYPLQAVANLEGVVVRATGRAGRALDSELFRGCELKGKAVLVHTGWDVHWRTERYGAGHPFLTRGAAEHLVAAGAALVGIDSLNIDDAADGARPEATGSSGCFASPRPAGAGTTAIRTPHRPRMKFLPPDVASCRTGRGRTGAAPPGTAPASVDQTTSPTPSPSLGW